jgi:hypothetical protein
VGSGGPHRLSASDILSDNYFGAALPISGGEKNACAGSRERIAHTTRS